MMISQLMRAERANRIERATLFVLALFMVWLGNHFAWPHPYHAFPLRNQRVTRKWLGNLNLTLC